MAGDYKAVLQFRHGLELNPLAESISNGNTPYSEVFIPSETEYTDRWVIAKTTSQRLVAFNPTKLGSDFTYEGKLDDTVISDGLMELLGIAKKIQGHPIQFNPNLLQLYVTFSTEESFLLEFGPIAKKLQRRLFKGGNITYTRSSTDYGVQFGTEPRKKGVLEIKTIEVEGTAQPANSLDELLRRLEQK